MSVYYIKLICTIVYRSLTLCRSDGVDLDLGNLTGDDTLSQINRSGFLGMILYTRKCLVMVGDRAETNIWIHRISVFILLSGYSK